MVSRIALLTLLLLAVPTLLAAGGGIDWPSLSPQPPVAVGGGVNDAALVVAIEEYEKLPWVLGAEANGTDWVLWLKESRGIRLDRIRQVLGGVGTIPEIRAEAQEAVAAVKPGGTLWFVFIGHGAPSPSQGGAALLGVATPRTEKGWSDPTYVFSRDAFLDELADGLPPDAQLVAVLDTCFSGQGSRGEELLEEALQGSYRADTWELREPGHPQGRGSRTVFVATSDQEYAGPLPGLGRPAFSYLLLGALRGWADDPTVSGDGSGTVSAREAVVYAETALRTALGGTRQQTPRLVSDAGGLGLPAAEPGPVLVVASGREDRDGGSRLGHAEQHDGDWSREAREAEQRDEAARLAEEDARRLRDEAERERQRLRGQAVEERQERRRTEYREAIEPLMSDDAGVESEEVVALWLESVLGETAVVPGEYEPLVVPEVEEAERARRWLAARGRRVGRGLVTVNRGQGWRESVMVEVPAGEFPYGCYSGMPRPQFRRCLGEGGDWHQRPVDVEAFLIDRTEVTVDRFLACVDAGDCPREGFERSRGYLEGCNASEDDSPKRPGHPMNCVSPQSADIFCRAIGGRVPTEQEWEKAARGTDGRSWPWGDQPPTCRRAVVAGCPGDGTQEVGTREWGASPYGVLDLAGNVEEWTSSCADESPNDPDCRRHRSRGGAFYARGRGVATFSRSSPTDFFGSPAIGFRCARSAAP